MKIDSFCPAAKPRNMQCLNPSAMDCNCSDLGFLVENSAGSYHNNPKAKGFVPKVDNNTHLEAKLLWLHVMTK